MCVQDLEGPDAWVLGLDVHPVQSRIDGDRRASCIPRPNDGMLSVVVGSVRPSDETAEE